MSGISTGMPQQSLNRSSAPTCPTFSVRVALTNSEQASQKKLKKPGGMTMEDWKLYTMGDDDDGDDDWDGSDDGDSDE